MIVESIILENWKKFRGPKEVEFAEGINIIYGDNESGKTTIVDSMRTAIFSKHTSKTQKIKGIVPWNSNLYPQASITFQNRDERYRLTKRFLGSHSLLERWNSVDWEKIAEGDLADKEVVNIIGGELPRSGDSKPQNWGLGQSLWMIQGDPIINDELNSDTISSLQSMIGASIESEDEKKVIKNIDQLFLSIFTKNKNLKKNSQLNMVKEEIEGLQSRLSSANTDLAHKEEILRLLDDGELSLHRYKKSLQEAEEKLEQLQKDVEEAKNHEIEREKVDGEVKTLNTQHSTLKEKIDEIKHINNSIKELTTKNAEDSPKMDQLQEKSQSNQEMIDSLKNKSMNLKSKIESIEYEKRFAGIALTTIREEMSLEDKKTQLQEFEELEEELINQKRELSFVIAPSKSELNVIEKLGQSIQNTEAQLDALGLSINACSHKSFSGYIMLDDENHTFTLDNNESQNWKAHQSVKINIPNFGEFEIKSGSQDVKEMMSSLESMKIKYDSELATYQCNDLEELRDALIKKDRLTSDIERIEASLDKKFKEGKESLLTTITQLENKIEHNWSTIPHDSPYQKCQEEDKNTASILMSQRIKKLEAEIDELKAQDSGLYHEIESIQLIQTETEENISDIKSEVYAKQQLIKSQQERLLIIEKDGMSLGERESNLNQISLDLDRKERVLSILYDEMEDIENKPKKAHDIYKEKEKRLQTDIRNIELSKAKNEADMDNLIKNSENGNKLEEELEIQKKKLNELEVGAEATKLLYDLTNHYHETTVTSLTSPIEKLVTENLRKLIGPKYSVEFGNNAKPSCVIPEGRTNDAPLDVLSFGTQEQIWCLFRLALGQLLSAEEKQLVVLDDPFVNTDPNRLLRAMEILEESSENLQIIIVTCNVEDYDELAYANRISMI